MTNTPDTTIEGNDRVAEIISTALEGHGTYDLLAELLVDLEPALAAIRRHAAAEALREQARILVKLEGRYLGTARNFDHGSEANQRYKNYAAQLRQDAGRLHRAAQDVIAEGWEHMCAAQFHATRDDPGYGCDAPVETEGDYCPRHEPADDYDPNQDD